MTFLRPGLDGHAAHRDVVEYHFAVARLRVAPLAVGGLQYHFGHVIIRVRRAEWVIRSLARSIAEVQDDATRWLWTYNHERPNTAIGGITPEQKLALVA